MRIFQAMAVFFKVLLNRQFAQDIKGMDQLRLDQKKLEDEITELMASKKLEAAKVQEKPKVDESEYEAGAIALLSLLQNEARFIDFVGENLEQVEDAKVGSISKLIHKDLKKVFEQFVKIEAVASVAEGGEIELAEGYDVSEYQLQGNVDKEPPFKGTLKHKGWMAHSINLPKKKLQSGKMIIQSARVEVA